jgi:hypothetical protein
MDITNTALIGTSEYEATIALAALEAEMDGDMALAEQIRRDHAEAKMLAAA